MCGLYSLKVPLLKDLNLISSVADAMKTFLFFFLLGVLVTEPRALCRLSTCSCVKLYPNPHEILNLQTRNRIFILHWSSQIQ